MIERAYECTYVRERVYVKVDGYACMHECVCVWPCGVGLDCPGWQGLLDGWVDVLACV